MLANLAASIIKHGRVHTTDAKAKEVKPFLERLVTFARRGDIHARRIVLARLKGDREAVKKLFDEIGPRYTARPGGYTRILKLGFRQGDNSPVSLIEFVEDEQQKKTAAKNKAKKAKPKSAKAASKDAAAAPVEDVAPAEADGTVNEEVKEEPAAAEAEAGEETAAESEATAEESSEEGKKEE